MIMGFILNPGQEAVVSAAVNWYKNSSELVFQYTGAAGTGKTVVLNEIIKRLNIPYDSILPMSYTGTAAIVMRNRGMTRAKTIHSSIYEPSESIMLDDNGKPVMDTYFNKPKTTLKWVKRERLHDIKLIIIDEASMTPRSMVEDIESFGIKIIACGDLNQLPPVGDDPGYLVSGKVYRLDQIMRQAEQSGIVYLADRAIKGLPIHFGFYNNAIVIPEDELTDQMALYADVILCCKNKTREYVNNLMRNDILKIRTQYPTFNEPLICRKNNWNIEVNGINLVNGLRGIVRNHPDITSIRKDLKEMTIDFLDDGNNIFSQIKMDLQYYRAPQDQKEFLKRSPYNKADKFELAYAITTHLSQGSQYSHGIFMEEFLHRDIMSNLIYTGITRFSNYMIYVKPKPKFF